MVLRIRGHPIRPQTKGRVASQGARHHLVAGVLIDAEGLAGQRGLVHAGVFGKQRAVHRDLLGWADQDDVPDRDVRHRDLLDLVGIRREQAERVLRGAVEKIREVALRAGLRVILQGLAPGDHEDDDQARDVLTDQQGGRHRHDGEDIQAGVPAQQVADHVRTHPEDDRHDEY